jgi:HEAT repeat protein
LIVEEHDLRELLPFVERLLADRSSEVRYDAAGCPGYLGVASKRARGSLRARLRDTRAPVRAQAAETLGNLGDRNSLPAIARLLSDRVPFVRSYAASTIGHFRDPGYSSRIRRALQEERTDAARVGILEASILLGDRNRLNDLLALLQPPDYHVRCSAANAIGSVPLRKRELVASIAALRHASRKPVRAADESTCKRVLKRLKQLARRSRE